MFTIKATLFEWQALSPRELVWIVAQIKATRGATWQQRLSVKGLMMSLWCCCVASQCRLEVQNKHTLTVAGTCMYAYGAIRPCYVFFVLPHSQWNSHSDFFPLSDALPCWEESAEGSQPSDQTIYCMLHPVGKHSGSPASESWAGWQIYVVIQNIPASHRGIDVDRKSTRLNSSHKHRSRMPSFAW